MNDIFNTLNAINVQEHIEKKNGLSYLPWAWAWAEIKKRYPMSTYTVYENADGLCYHTDGKTAWVKTGVTVVDGDTAIEHIEYLPVMDMRNKSIALAAITSFDVNKAIQRSLTKAVARHGLGLYVYAGEDLPEDEKPEPAPRHDTMPPPVPMPTVGPVHRWTASDDIKAFCEAMNIESTAFAAYRKAAIMSNLVPDIPSKELTKSQCADLLAAIKTTLGVAS